MALQKPYHPVAITPLEATFPTNVDHLMPAYAEIPIEFKKSSNPYVKLFSQWFFSGLKANPFTNPRPGIDKVAAKMHLKCVMGSWEPKHEHKEAAVAYLISLWFIIDGIKE